MKSVWITFVLLSALTVGTAHYYAIRSAEASAAVGTIVLTTLALKIDRVCTSPNL